MTPFGRRVRELRERRGITLARMAEGLGVTPAYLSALEHGKRGRPTFTLIQEYRGGRVPLVHVDLYRLEDAREIDELGLEEIAAYAVTAIEWAERLPRIPPGAIRVRIDHAEGDERTLTLEA